MPIIAFLFLFFFFNDTATTEIYTLSLHDALPISLDVAGIELSAGAPRLRGLEGSAVATGGVLPPQLPHHFLRQHRHELRRRGVDASSGAAEQRDAAKRTPVLRRLAAGYRPHPLTPGSPRRSTHAYSSPSPRVSTVSTSQV